MALFNFGKKKEETKTSDCGCSCSCGCDTAPDTEATPKVVDPCCEKETEGICRIKVLGSGCKSCHALLESTKEAVNAMGLSVEVDYVTDMQQIMEYGVMSMPGLVVNEKVVSMGKALKAADVEKLLRKLGF